MRQEEELAEWVKKETVRVKEWLSEATERLHVAKGVELNEEQTVGKKGYQTQKEAQRAAIEGLINLGVMEDVNLDSLQEEGIEPTSCGYVLTERAQVGSGLHKARHVVRGLKNWQMKMGGEIVPQLRAVRAQ